MTFVKKLRKFSGFEDKCLLLFVWCCEFFRSAKMSDFFRDCSVVFGTIMTIHAHLFLPHSLKD